MAISWLLLMPGCSRTAQIIGFRISFQYLIETLCLIQFLMPKKMSKPCGAVGTRSTKFMKKIIMTYFNQNTRYAVSKHFSVRFYLTFHNKQVIVIEKILFQNFDDSIYIYISKYIFWGVLYRRENYKNVEPNFCQEVTIILNLMISYMAFRYSIKNYTRK